MHFGCHIYEIREVRVYLHHKCLIINRYGVQVRTLRVIGTYFWNETKLILKSGKLKLLMGLKLQFGSFEPIDYLEWQSVVASVR